MLICSILFLTSVRIQAIFLPKENVGEKKKDKKNVIWDEINAQHLQIFSVFCLACLGAFSNLT